MKVLIWLSITFIVFIFIIFARQNFASGTGNFRARLGYCPIMKTELNKLNISELELFEFNNSQEVLKALQNKKIDIAVIGRKARREEITEQIRYLQLRPEDVTLVSLRYAQMTLENLENINIHTWLNTDELGLLFSNLNVIAYETSKEASSNGLNEAVLINWRDVDYEKHELLVALDNGGNKLEYFRSPHVYFEDVNIVKNLLH
jgi:hypothetical protein